MNGPLRLKALIKRHMWLCGAYFQVVGDAYLILGCFLCKFIFILMVIEERIHNFFKFTFRGSEMYPLGFLAITYQGKKLKVVKLLTNCQKGITEKKQNPFWKILKTAQRQNNKTGKNERQKRRFDKVFFLPYLGKF